MTLDFYAALLDEDRNDMEQTGTILWHALFSAGLVS